ncbi:type II toxin-antitoxin system prevent-host-death family antitoxin [Deltaproteobacteria bacterium TL4]
MHATAKDLKSHTKEILDRASGGEEVIVTYKGKPYVKIVPFHQHSELTKASPKKLALFGIWKNHEASEDVSALLHKMTLEIHGVRQAMISEHTHTILFELMKFRHFK